MKYKILTIMLTGILCCSIPMNANASEIQQQNNDSLIIDNNDDVMPISEGLIIGASISCSGGSKTIYLTAQTIGSEKMSKIGLKNISIERSSDNKSWSEEKSISDMLNESSVTHTLDKYAISVSGGYYYRISCTHYAKEKGLFGSSQSVDNVSNSVWVSK